MVVRESHREGDRLVLEVENRFLFTDLSQCGLVVNGERRGGAGAARAPGRGGTPWGGIGGGTDHAPARGR